MVPLETSLQISNESFSRSWSKDSKPSSDVAAECAGAGVRRSLDIIPDGRGSSSFIEMDPKLVSLRRRTDSFEFGRPSVRPSVLVHADEIISNGHLLPLHLMTPPKGDAIVSSSSSSNAAAHPSLLRSLSVDSSKPFLSRSNQFRSGRCPALSKAASLESTLISPVQAFAASSYSSPSSTRTLAAGSCGKKKSALLEGCAKSCKMLFRKYAFFLSPWTKKVNALASTTTRRREDGRSAWCCMASRGTSSPTKKRWSNAYPRSESSCRKVVDAGTEKAIQDAVLHCKNSFSKS